MNPINIALAADSSNDRQLAVVLAGLSRSATDSPYQVFTMHDGFEPALVDRVSRAAGAGISLQWIDARSSTLDAARLPPNLPLATLFRLRIPVLFPPDVERVIYLDADTVVRESLLELWSSDIGDAIVGAVRDPVLGWAGAPDNLDWRTLGVRPETPYFNAGVLVIPLARWREEHLCDRALDLMARHSFGDADQGALNVVVDGRWRQLEPRWNLQGGHLVGQDTHACVVERPDLVDSARDQPAVVHYNRGPWRRPWEDRRAYGHQTPHALRDLWFEDLDATPWSGWRPDDRRPSRLAGVMRRVQRAGRVLARGRS